MFNADYADEKKVNHFDNICTPPPNVIQLPTPMLSLSLSLSSLSHSLSPSLSLSLSLSLSVGVHDYSMRLQPLYAIVCT